MSDLMKKIAAEHKCPSCSGSSPAPTQWWSRPSKKEYVEAAFQRVMEAEKMGLLATAVFVELGTIWDVAHDKGVWDYADVTRTRAGLNVERVIDILDEAEEQGYTGPDYTPRHLAEFIVDSLNHG